MHFCRCVSKILPVLGIEQRSLHQTGSAILGPSLRRLLQQEMIVIPKGPSEEHLRENLQVFDFHISPEQDEQVRAMT